jgi:hypothetical protein
MYIKFTLDNFRPPNSSTIIQSSEMPTKSWYLTIIILFFVIRASLQREGVRNSLPNYCLGTSFLFSLILIVSAKRIKLFFVHQYSEEDGKAISQECQLLFTDEIFQIPSVTGKTQCANK